MRKIGIAFVSAIFICGLSGLISCGEEKETKPQAKEGGVSATITVEALVGSYELVSYYDKDEENTLVVGSKEAGDFKHTRVINSDNSYSIEEVESGKKYTESGAFSLSGDRVAFEVKKSSDPKNVNVKNSYSAKIDGDKLILTLQDSTDPLFKEDVGDVLTYKKIKK